MSIFRFLSILIVPIMAIMIVSCAAQSSEQELDPEAQKYLPSVNEYCQKNNLKLSGYLGKTIIRSQDFNSSHIGREPVVYEWRVMNKASKIKFVLWVGPIMPDYKKIKPGIMLGKDRYTLKGMKTEEKSN